MGLGVVRTSRTAASDWFGSHGCVRLREEDAQRLYMGRQHDQHRGALTRRLRWFWLLGALGLLGVAAICVRFLSASHGSQVLPGTVVFEMQPTLLVKVEYSTPKRRVTVTRPNDSDDPFSVVVTDATGKQVERCQA